MKIIPKTVESGPAKGTNYLAIVTDDKAGIYAFIQPIQYNFKNEEYTHTMFLVAMAAKTGKEPTLHDGINTALSEIFEAAINSAAFDIIKNWYLKETENIEFIQKLDD